jgi:probable HAF family extracellular repeat protein
MGRLKSESGIALYPRPLKRRGFSAMEFGKEAEERTKVTRSRPFTVVAVLTLAAFAACSRQTQTHDPLAQSGRDSDPEATSPETAAPEPARAARSSRETPFGTAAAQRFTIRDLGTLGGTASGALAVNEAGQVAGWSLTSSGLRHAFLYRDGVMTDLGALGGKTSWACALNDQGQVVGWLRTARRVVCPFLYDQGIMRTLGTFGGRETLALGLNNVGHIVGSGWTAGGAERAFLSRDGALRDLGTLGGSFSEAHGINSVGQVVGAAGTRYDWFTHAFLWSEGRMEDLGTLGGDQSVATGINDAGQVVGWSNTASKAEHAFLYSEGEMRDLGTLGGQNSHAAAINSAGQVVGVSWIVKRSVSRGFGRMRAFLCQGGVMVDVNRLIPAESGWMLVAAQDINDAGQIVGMGRFRDQTRAFLLTPLPQRSFAGGRTHRHRPRNPPS